MEKKKKQFVSLSIRLTEEEYKAVLAEKQRIGGSAGVDVSINAVLTGILRTGLDTRYQQLRNGEQVIIPASVL